MLAAGTMRFTDAPDTPDTLPIAGDFDGASFPKQSPRAPPGRDASRENAVAEAEKSLASREASTEARERAEASEASQRTLTTALRMVRTTVEEEKRRWIEELRAARDDVCRLRIELAPAKEEIGELASSFMPLQMFDFVSWL